MFELIVFVLSPGTSVFVLRIDTQDSKHSKEVI
jgi:hypothetical protein